MDKLTFKKDVRDFMASNNLTIHRVARLAGIEHSSFWRFMTEDKRELTTSAAFAVWTLMYGDEACMRVRTLKDKDTGVE